MSERPTFEDLKVLQAKDWAYELLGFPGAMLSGVKDSKRFPKAVWNANVCAKSFGKLWFGDLDLGNDETRTAITRLATFIDEPVYVLREMDARFDTEYEPKFDKAVERFWEPLS